jgi:dihydrofolate reductase
MKLNFIVCCDNKDGIGRDGTIPWSFAEDMQWFREKTDKGIVIMGRNTWRTLKHELPGRHTIVMTSGEFHDGPNPPETHIGDLIGSDDPVRTVAYSTDEAIEICKLIKQYRNDPQVWIAGGQAVYESFVKEHPDLIGDLYFTQIDGDFECDKHFPIDLVREQPIDYTTQKMLISATSSTCVDRKTGRPYMLNFIVKRIVL